MVNPTTAREILDLLTGPSNSEEGIIFDLDGTLFSNIPRQLAIYEDLRETFDLPPLDEFLSEREYTILKHLPTALEARNRKGKYSEELQKKLKAVILEKFLSGDYVHYDTPFLGANSFVHQLREHGYQIFYVTGRHEAPEEISMKPATIQSLETHNFPLPSQEGIHLVMKPSVTQTDSEFKHEIFFSWKSVSPVPIVAAFENEALFCEFLQEAFPEAIVVRFKGGQSTNKIFRGYLLEDWS